MPTKQPKMTKKEIALREKFVEDIRKIAFKQRTGIIFAIAPEGLGTVGNWPNFGAMQRQVALRGLIVELIARYGVSIPEIFVQIELLQAQLDERKKKNNE